MESTTTAKPRILLLSTAYLPLIGGSELAIHHIANRLTGTDFDLVTGRYHPTTKLMETIGRVRVFRAGGRWARIPLVLPKLLLPIAIAATALRLMRTHHYDAVHAYQASQAAGAAWLMKLFRPGVPLIITIQEGKDLENQSWLVRLIRSAIIRRADVITAISAHLAAYAGRYASSPVHIIPNGVTIHTIPQVKNPDPTILTVSRLVPKNNVEGVIRAFAAVRRSITNARLAIVGDGPLRQDLESLASELGIRDTVDFMGIIPHEQLAVVYAAADVFVRPSLSEGLGSVFLEAMAARVPVVASAVGGIPDIVHDEQTGLVCNQHDAADIARAIVRVLEDRPLRERMVLNAERMVREKYDWDIIALHMDRLYKEIARP
ncbi:MAG: glycosyltransferase family 4 protein [Patescibacteria group bacterium]